METHKITIPVTIIVTTSAPKRAGIDFAEEFIMRRLNDFSSAFGGLSPNPTYGEITSVVVDEDGSEKAVVEESDEA